MPEWRLKNETPSKGELVTIPWPGIEATVPGNDYHADDLESIRFTFLSSRRNRKVSLAGGPREIKKFTYVFSSLDGKKGECRIHRISKDAEEIKGWYWRLPVDINDERENLPFANRKVLRALLRHPMGGTYLTIKERRYGQLKGQLRDLCRASTHRRLRSRPPRTIGGRRVER